jgi:predicted transcriptional regulator
MTKLHIWRADMEIIDEAELFSTSLIIEKLKARRMELGLTQADVDDLLDTSYGLCGKWEAGMRVPLASSLARWIDCLACTVDIVPLESIDVE